jgi:hypothetical protein
MGVALGGGGRMVGARAPAIGAIGPRKGANIVAGAVDVAAVGDGAVDDGAEGVSSPPVAVGAA